MMTLSVNRVRSVVENCKTEIDLVSTLRKHKIKYTFSTDHGFLQVRIPYRKGYIRIYRTCSRSCPFMVTTIPSVPYIAPVPVIHNFY